MRAGKPNFDGLFFSACHFPDNDLAGTIIIEMGVMHILRADNRTVITKLRPFRASLFHKILQVKKHVTNVRRQFARLFFRLSPKIHLPRRFALIRLTHGEKLRLKWNTVKHNITFLLYKQEVSR
jgi:hypothetical protein